MNLQISGHHLEITPALHDYVTSKLERVTRHFDHVIDVNVILSVEKLKQKAEVTVHLPTSSIVRFRSTSKNCRTIIVARK